MLQLLISKQISEVQYYHRDKKKKCQPNSLKKLSDFAEIRTGVHTQGVWLYSLRSYPLRPTLFYEEVLS